MNQLKIWEKEILKIYFRNGSYKSFQITNRQTGSDLLQMIAEKFDIPASYLDIYESIRGTERKIQAGDNLWEKKSKWPTIFGKQGVETNLHCHFLVLIKRGSPEGILEKFDKATK